MYYIRICFKERGLCQWCPEGQVGGERGGDRSRESLSPVAFAIVQVSQSRPSLRFPLPLIKRPGTGSTPFCLCGLTLAATPRAQPPARPTPRDYRGGWGAPFPGDTNAPLLSADHRGAEALGGEDLSSGPAERPLGDRSLRARGLLVAVAPRRWLPPEAPAGHRLPRARIDRGIPRARLDGATGRRRVAPRRRGRGVSQVAADHRRADDRAAVVRGDRHLDRHHGDESSTARAGARNGHVVDALGPGGDDRERVGAARVAAVIDHRERLELNAHR